jgi:OTU domain-containing protein 6
MEVESVEERYAREKKELRNTISDMLKNARDKKAKKEVRVQIQILEDQLAERHQREIQEQALTQQTEGIQEEDANEELKPSKAMKKKAAKQAKAKQRRAELEEEAKGMVDYKAIENEALASKLQKLNLQVVEIPADGHCLYRSISRQLQILEGTDISVEQLRKLTAQYIASHPDDFVAFLLSEENDDLEDVDTYVAKIVQTEPVHWGGEPELVALSGVLNRDIVVHSADSALWKASAVEARGERLPLQVSYHKYYFGLGNHYNSVETL